MRVFLEEGEYVMEVRLENGCTMFVDRDKLGGKRKVTSLFCGDKGIKEEILPNGTLYYINGAFKTSQITGLIDAIVARNTMAVHGLPAFQLVLSSQGPVGSKVEITVPQMQADAIMSASLLSFEEMHLLPLLFKYLGKEKLWELLPDVPKRRHWDTSTIVKVINEDSPNLCYYVAVMTTCVFEDYMCAVQSLGVHVVLPFLAKNVNEASRFYHNIPGYSESSREHGVRAFRMIRL
jgi:hypothetical protein